MTNHPDSNSELVRTFSTILRANSYDLSHDEISRIWPIYHRFNSPRKSIDANLSLQLCLFSLSLWRKIGAIEKLEQREK